MPRDAVLDTGSPLCWFPESVWSRMALGTDYEVLPFEPGYVPPVGRTAGWTFGFRLALLLAPLVLFDTQAQTQLVRHDLIVQFTDGNPPARGFGPPRVVIGLGGSALAGTRLVFGPGPTPAAALEW